MGFKTDHVFDVYTQGENVNVFNGALNISRPIAAFSVNGNLSYGLTLNYGSKQWFVDDEGTCSGHDDHWELANPSWVSAGWSLHFGQIIDTAASTCGGAPKKPMFISSDGATHELHAVPGLSGDYITRDSSYIRALRYPASSGHLNGWKVFLQDGTILDLRHHVTSPHERVTGWYTTLMMDPWGNRLDIEYYPAPHAQAMNRLVDGQGRITTFSLWPDDPGVLAEKRGKLKEVRFPTFQDDPAAPTGRVEFDYEIATIGMPIVWQNNLPSPSVSQALLSELRLPESATYTYTHDTLGEITSITYPTGAVSSYVYHQYFFEVFGPGRPEDPPMIDYRREQGVGVLQHSLDLDGNASTTNDRATWSYMRGTGIPWFLTAATRMGPAPFLVRVRDPNGNDTWHEFAGYRQSADSLPQFSSPTHLLVSTREYAGPTTYHHPVSGNDWSLSGHLLSTTHQKWEEDGYDPGAGSNSRVYWTKTVMAEDGSWRSESHCGYNGLGKFATTTERSQSFKDGVPYSTTRRSSVTEWVPILCQWILSTSARSELSEDGLAIVTRSRFGIRGELLETLTDDAFIAEDPGGPACNGDADPFIRIGTTLPEAGGQLASHRPSMVDLAANPYPAPPSACLPAAFASALTPGPGDVKTTNVWFGPVTATGSGWLDEEDVPSAGNLKSTTTSGADSAASFTREFRWSHGAARWARAVGLPWKMFKDEIDPASGLRLASTGADGVRTEYDWDRLGRLKKIIPDPSVTTGAVMLEAPTRIDYTFMPATAHVIKGFDDAPAAETTDELHLYDTLGRIVRQNRRDVDGSILSQLTRWSPSGLRLAVSEWIDTDVPDPHAAITSSFVETAYSYDWTLPSGITVTDPRHRVRLVRHPDGAIAEFDHVGLRERRRVPGINGDPLQVSETVLHGDMLGRLVIVDAPVGSADAFYHHDIHGKLRRADLDGQIRTWTRDALGRVIQEFHPESGTISFPSGDAFDALGNVLRRIDADGRDFRSTFDVAGRPLTTSVIESPGQPPQLLTELFYDEAANGPYSASKITRSVQWNCLPGSPCEAVTREQHWTGLSGRLGEMRLSQDACDLVLKAGFEYDHLGLENVRHMPDIVSTTCPYSKVGWLKEVVTTFRHGLSWRLGTPSSPGHYIDATVYAPQGAPSSVLLGNGVMETTTFDSRDRISGISATRAGITIFETGNHAYDGASNIVSFGPTFERPQPQSFTYDLVGRLRTADLPGVGTFRHDYDAWGNMTNSLLAHGAEPECVPGGFFGWGQFADRQYLRGQNGVIESIPTNRTSSLGSACFPSAVIDHDNAGRVLRDETSRYTWNAQDRLLRRERLDGGTDEKYVYDAAGYRARIDHSNGDQTIEFRGPDGEIWRSLKVLGGGALQRDGDSIRSGSRLVASDGFETNLAWHHADHLGSTRATTLWDGTRRDRFEYSPFGLDLPQAGGALPTADRAFATHEREGDGTLDYMMGRWMSPAGAKFLSVDPAVESIRSNTVATWNRYGYVLGNPLLFVDPDGRCVIIWDPRVQKMYDSNYAQSARFRAAVAPFEGTTRHLTIRTNTIPDVNGDRVAGKTEPAGGWTRNADGTIRQPDHIIIDINELELEWSKEQTQPPIDTLAHEVGHAEDINVDASAFTVTADAEKKKKTDYKLTSREKHADGVMKQVSAERLASQRAADAARKQAKKQANEARKAARRQHHTGSD